MDKRVLSVLFVATLLYIVALALIIPFLPFRVLALGGSYRAAGAVFSAFSAAAFLSAPLWGIACDRWGTRRVLASSAIATGICYILLLTAETLPMVFAARIGAGLSAGWLIASQTLVAHYTTNRMRTKGLGMLGAAFGIGFGLGHFLSAWLIGDKSTPSSLPVLAACVFTLLACMTVFLIPSTRSPQTASPAASPENFGIKSLLLVLTREKTLMIVVSVYFCVSLAFHGFEGVFAVWADKTFALGPRQVAILLACSAVVVIVVQGGVVGALARKWGEKLVVASGILFLTIGFLGLALSVALWHIYVAIGLIALGISLHNPAMQSLVSKTTQRHGRGFGFLNALSSLSRALAPIGWGVVAAAFGGGVVFSVLALGLCLVFLFLLLNPLPSKGFENREKDDVK